MSRRLVILGAGGHAKMVIEAARTQSEFEPVVCLAQTIEQPQILGVPVEIESEQILRELRSQSDWAFVAVGSNRLRAKLQSLLTSMGYSLATIISSQAWISPSATIGAGTVVMPGAIVGACASVGQGVILNTASSIDHDCQVEDFVHIAPGCHLAGNVRVGANSFLGVGVSVIPEKSIGSSSVVGAGAVVVRHVPSGETWVGCPARKISASA